MGSRQTNASPPVIDVVLLTEDRYAIDRPTDWYTRNILLEDHLVASALARQGLSSQRVSWSDPDLDWSGARAVLFRSTWDYFDQYAEFMGWLDRTARLTQLLNPPELIRWNADKHYLGDLRRRGIHIPETQFVETGTTKSLAELLRQSGWSEAILKPAVSGAARHTYRLTPANVASHENVYRERIAQEAFLLQRFQPSILEDGELSLIVIGGRFSHAVRKLAQVGDFRVQDDHGGTAHFHHATTEEIDFAERCVAVCEPRPLYARVDVLRDTDGQPALMELELIEPELFFRFWPRAAERLAEEVATVLLF